MDILPVAAERFLLRFEQALSLFGCADREALVRKTRSLLRARVAEGRLHGTLVGLGTPEGYAQRLAGSALPAPPLVSACRALVPIVDDVRSSPMKAVFGNVGVRIRAIIDDLKATFAASRDEIWGISLVLFAGLTVTNFVLSAQQITPSHSMPSSFASLGVRFLIIAFGMIALYRSLLTEDQRIWDINLATFRYIGANLLLFMVFAAVAKLALVTALYVSGHARPSFAEQVGMVSFIGLLASAAYLRTQPWLVALSVGDRGVSLSKALAVGEGFSRTLLGWALCVAPLFLLHMAVSAVADQLPASALFRYGLAFSAIDGGIATLLCLSIAHINVIAYRRVAAKPMPSPRPYSSKEPSLAYLSYTRDIFLHRLAQDKLRRLTPPSQSEAN